MQNARYAVARCTQEDNNTTDGNPAAAAAVARLVEIIQCVCGGAARRRRHAASGTTTTIVYDHSPANHQPETAIRRGEGVTTGLERPHDAHNTRATWTRKRA